MENKELLFTEAIGCCRILYESTREAKAVLKASDPQRILGMADLLAGEMENVRQKERSLGRLSSSQLTSQQLLLRTEWLTLHDATLRETQRVVQLLKRHMALTRQELQRLSTGKKIAAGYHSNVDRRGRKLDING